MRGSDGPGPSRYDRVRVVRIGSSSARHVLVLLPGTSAGAGYFVPVAEDLVAALRGWQVWAVDRRENLLEDHTVLDRARAGGVGGQAAVRLLPRLDREPGDRSPLPAAGRRAARVRARWGMRVAVDDVARVVRAARAGGRHVVLGGHSLGGWIATAYAAWDFGGRAGARDLDGLVLIDGASGAPAISPAERTADARRDRARLAVPRPGRRAAAVDRRRAQRRRLDAGRPRAGRALAAAGLAAAARRGQGRRCPRRTSRSSAYSVDADTSPESLAAGQAHLGRLAASGDPRGFQDGGYATAARVARAVSGIPGATASPGFIRAA